MYSRMRRSVLIGIVVFISVLLLTQYISYQRYLIRKEAEVQRVARELQTVKDRLTSSLSYSFSAVKTLAFIVSTYGVPTDFDSVAQNILQGTQYIDALQLTQQGVITHVYPSAGNEAAKGFDILSDRVTRMEANHAIEKRELFFAGPFELKQGGKAIVGRLPIFKENEFQGFAVVIIRLGTLLKAIGLDAPQQGEFTYQLSKTNPTTQQEEYFLSQSFDEDRGQYASIDVPAGDWKLWVMARSEHRLFFNLTFSLVGLILSITGGVFAWYLVRQPEILKKLVDKKTAQVINSQNQYKITLERVSDGFISYDREWRYRYINGEAENVLGLTLSEVAGKNIWEEFPELINQPIYDAYHKAIADQRYVFIESYLPNREKWFENHLYPSADGLSVFFRDITERKNTDKLIEINETRLMEAQAVAKLGSWETDLVTMQVVWSLQTYLIFELDPITFKPTHTTFLDFVHPKDRAQVDKAFAESFRCDDWCVIEHRIITHKGQLKWVEERWKVFQNEQHELYRAAGTCQDITERIIAERELVVYTEEIKRLTAHLEQVREDERTRIAREVHDELGQQLTGLKMDASWLAKKISREEKALHEKLSGMISLMDDTVKTIRRISSDLRPGMLDDLGLVATLEWQCSEFSRHTEIKCSFTSELHDVSFERNLSTTIFRIFQESLTNVMRHANASTVAASLTQTDVEIVLMIADNGRGFDAAEVKTKGTLGLIGIRERALMAGATVQIESEKRVGTRVILKIPVALVVLPTP